MDFTRRDCLTVMVMGALGASARLRLVAAQNGDLNVAARRIAGVITEYEAQGFHRTGTTVDRVSGEWLADQVQRIGLAPTLESFPLSRVDPVTSTLVVGERRVEGLPLFDSAFTDARGIDGRLGAQDSDAEVLLTHTAVNAAGAGQLGDARRANRHKAIVVVTQGRRPGLCPSNADSFIEPFGPPVLQVSSHESSWLGEQARASVQVRVTTQVNRAAVTADNVTTSLHGTDPALPPLVIMTPRSGWYWCASERGGGIAVWLEIMRALRGVELRRSIEFVASSGHELGHLGIDAFIARRPGIVKQSVGWLHLGANIGAATEPGTRLQASDDDFEAMLTRTMMAAGLSVSARTQRGRIPGGEAEAVHRGGGRYVSTIGSNGLFHNLDDRGPGAIDPLVIARFSEAFSALAGSIAGRA